METAPQQLGHYSTKQAAELVDLSYLTLRRWLAHGSFVPTIVLPFGRGRNLWVFTESDVEKLRAYKANFYCTGRGRQAGPRLRDDKERLAYERLQDEFTRLGLGHLNRDIIPKFGLLRILEMATELVRFTERATARDWAARQMIGWVQEKLAEELDVYADCPPLPAKPSRRKVGRWVLCAPEDEGQFNRRRRKAIGEIEADLKALTKQYRDVHQAMEEERKSTAAQ